MKKYTQLMVLHCLTIVNFLRDWQEKSANIWLTFGRHLVNVTKLVNILAKRLLILQIFGVWSSAEVRKSCRSFLEAAQKVFA